MEQVAFCLIIVACGLLSILGAVCLCNSIFDLLCLHSNYYDNNRSRTFLIVVLIVIFTICALLSIGVELLQRGVSP